MNLVEFPEQTIVIAKDQPQYRPLPAHAFQGDPRGRIVCCWQLTWRERIVVLLLGRVWHEILTFKMPLQPQLLLVDKPAMRSPTDASDEVIVRINGRRLPRRLVRVNPEAKTFRLTLLGRVALRVMKHIPGSDLSSVTYPAPNVPWRC